MGSLPYRSMLGQLDANSAFIQAGSSPYPSCGGEFFGRAPHRIRWPSATGRRSPYCYLSVCTDAAFVAATAILCNRNSTRALYCSTTVFVGKGVRALIIE